jgi:hypothetical protein
MRSALKAMKVNSKSYPHPVLGHEDDLGGSFDVEFHYELGHDEIILNPKFDLKNKALEDLMRKGQASFVVEIECASTFFRRSFSTRNNVERFAVPSKLVRARVVVGFFICCDAPVKDYKPSECHPDYAGETFDVEQGDVLATGGFSYFVAEKTFDPLRPPVSSFMSIMEGTLFEGPVQIDYETEKITVILSKTDWGNYLAVRGNNHAVGVLHSAIVLPVLVDAIHQVQNERSEYSDSPWFGRLDAILEAKGLRKKEPFEAAQKILDNPASRGLHGIGGMLDINEGEAAAV